MLTAQEYQEQGFVVLPKLLDTDEISDILASFETILGRFDDSSNSKPIIERYAGIRGMNRKIGGAIYDTMTTSLTLQKIFTSDKITKPVGDFLGVEATRLTHFFRCMRLDPPGDNPNELSWHQDFQDSSYPANDATRGLTVWIPLTAVGKDKGSIEVCIGSHGERITGVTVDPRGGGAVQSKEINIDAREAEKFPRLVLELEPGDAVFMSMNLLHRSFPAPQGADWRITVLGRFFDSVSPSFLPGAQRFVASPL